MLIFYKSGITFEVATFGPPHTRLCTNMLLLWKWLMLFFLTSVSCCVFSCHSREVPVSADHEVRLAVLVDDLGGRLEPDPAQILGVEAVRDEPRAPRLDHCSRKRALLLRAVTLTRTHRHTHTFIHDIPVECHSSRSLELT